MWGKKEEKKSFHTWDKLGKAIPFEVTVVGERKGSFAWQKAMSGESATEWEKQAALLSPVADPKGFTPKHGSLTLNDQLLEAHNN